MCIPLICLWASIRSSAHWHNYWQTRSSSCVRNVMSSDSMKMSWKTTLRTSIAARLPTLAHLLAAAASNTALVPTYPPAPFSVRNVIASVSMKISWNVTLRTSKAAQLPTITGSSSLQYYTSAPPTHLHSSCKVRKVTYESGFRHQLVEEGKTKREAAANKLKPVCKNKNLKSHSRPLSRGSNRPRLRGRWLM